MAETERVPAVGPFNHVDINDVYIFALNVLDYFTTPAVRAMNPDALAGFAEEIIKDILTIQPLYKTGDVVRFRPTVGPYRTGTILHRPLSSANEWSYRIHCSELSAAGAQTTYTEWVRESDILAHAENGKSA